MRLSAALRASARHTGRLAQERRVQELLAQGARPCVPLVSNSVGMGMALVPPGSFLMGSPDRENDRQGQEGPRHEVRITRPFYLGIHTVTFGQLRQFAQATGHRTQAEV